MLVDTHCHLNFDAFKNDLEEVMAQAKNAGVEKIVIPGAKIDSSERGVEIANKHDNCFVAVGVHPHHSEELRYQGIKVLRYKLEELAKNKKVVAIGEIGLDYHEYQKTVYEKYQITDEAKRLQKELLALQIEIAIKTKLPIIFHCRDAFNDMLGIISKYSSPKLRGVFHCFGGSQEDLKQVLARGFYVGFDGNITYKNAENLRELVKLTSIERMLIETDSPFLAPEPHRGKRNEPKNVKIVAWYIAELKTVSSEKIAQMTTQNADKLFLI